MLYRMDTAEVIKGKYQALTARLDETTLRLRAAVEARTLGRGGVSTVAKAIAMSRTTIYAGLKELDSPAPSEDGHVHRIRNKGDGRKILTVNEIIDANLFRTTFWLPFQPCVLKVSNHFFFLVSNEMIGSPATWYCAAMLEIWLN